MESTKPQEPALNNYSNKSIQFYKKDNRYILIFADAFFSPSKENFIIADLYKDLQEADKKCEIHIFIDSPGGDCGTLEMLASEIRKFAQVVTICRANAMSAGFLLWLIGDERYVSASAALMFHQMGYSGWLDMKSYEVKNWNEFSLKLNKQLLKEFQVEKFCRQTVLLIQCGLCHLGSYNEGCLSFSGFFQLICCKHDILQNFQGKTNQ